MTEPSPRPSDPEPARPIWDEHPVGGGPGSAGIGGPGSSGGSAGFGSAGFGTAGFGRSGDSGSQLFFGGPVFAGSPGRLDSEAALRQYLIVRALGRSVVNTLQWAALAILALAVVCWLAGVKVLAVLIGLVLLAVLLLRSLLSALGRRLSGRDRLGPVEPEVRRLVARTGRGLRRELRRVGLPGAPWAPVLIALRLLRPFRRQQTALALARVDLNRVVPAGQLDELHLLLQSAGRPH
jgi:hypothetical protein